MIFQSTDHDEQFKRDYSQENVSNGHKNMKSIYREVAESSRRINDLAPQILQKIRNALSPAPAPKARGVAGPSKLTSERIGGKIRL